MSTDRSTLEPDEILARLLAEEPGWHSDISLSWKIGGNSAEARRDVRRELSNLARRGTLERLWVRHKDNPMPITYVDHGQIRSVLGGAE